MPHRRVFPSSLFHYNVRSCFIIPHLESQFLAHCDVSFAYHAKPIVRAAVTHAINHSGLDAIYYSFI